MISYPYIQELFTNVLSKSKAIGGRFFVSAKQGREINNDDLEQAITDEFAGKTGAKYPLAFMMPPRSFGSFTDPAGEWERFQLILFFLKTTYVSGSGQTQSPNPATRTSTHTVVQDWHDMKRCAVNFVGVLNQLQRSRGTINTTFRLNQEYERTIQPVSFIGVDRLSGVRLDLVVNLFNGCVLEDYTPQDITAITLPAGDSHPEHQM